MTALDTILTRLRTDLGLTPNQAAAIAGNWQIESGFRTDAYNGSEGAVGLAQWEGGREQALRQFAASRGTTESDLDTQIAFAESELTGPYSGALADLKATDDPAAGAAVIDSEYEVSAGTSRAQRIAAAQAIAAGSPTTTGPAAPSGSSSGSSSGGSSIASGIGGWMGLGGTAFTVGIKVLGVAAAAGLVIVGATRTVSSK